MTHRKGRIGTKQKNVYYLIRHVSKAKDFYLFIEILQLKNGNNNRRFIWFNKKMFKFEREMFFLLLLLLHPQKSSQYSDGDFKNSWFYLFIFDKHFFDKKYWYLIRGRENDENKHWFFLFLKSRICYLL